MTDIYIVESQKLVILIQDGRMREIFYIRRKYFSKDVTYVNRVSADFCERSYAKDGIIHLCPIDVVNLFVWLFYSFPEARLRKKLREIFAGSLHIEAVLNAICFATNPKAPKRPPVGEDRYFANWVAQSDPEFGLLRDGLRQIQSYH
ncbi:hypothetical protein VQ042_10945 [Aurantimonas sp. A2-1-M11]|uniref:hypothetical protein n=1 Tax=Aurantimonas sp. A2-1-M11 TaxID=3113712 RepID=UPI002F93117B